MGERKGLYNKYAVTKQDGTPIEDCFVLRPAQDRHAWKALHQYALAVADENPTLYYDLLLWLDEIKHQAGVK